MFARVMIAAALLAAPAFAQSQDQNAAEGPPKRVRSILLYNDDSCPKPASPDEIVVCSNAGESPYRIPKRFRDQPKQDAPSTSWTRRMEVVEEVNSRGMPNSCSPVGTGGQTGCTRQMLQRWYQEKLDKEAAASRVP
ncbi:hypothetical protein ACNFJ7_03080 [Sphingomonas sp. HT-1]|uniref:hypothetical protein n=1 Tax=unclassified Sphingomonas TaxID=196159 RepID=UPI0002E2EE5C|nr:MULTISPECIES: hypothetical protein [unclassified Sphingomonas]KTF68463.1 hypothetical protein ATB93_13830 [Sphingomonas sp. WG]